MSLRIETNVPLDQYTTLQVGGVAAYFTRLTDEAQLPEIVAVAAEKEVPIWVFGGGSNVLVSDGVMNRMAVKNELSGIEIGPSNGKETLVTAAAGEKWDDLVALVVKQDLAGLENLSGVPGTVGAAPIQNINCYGAQVGDVIELVRVYDTETKTFRELSVEDCAFGYRDSIFKRPAGASLIVTAVTIRLAPAGRTNLTYQSASQSIEKYLQESGVATPTPADVREAVLEVRSNIGMLEGQFRSAGSFFKNTVVTANEFTHIADIVRTQFPKLDKKLSPWHWSLSDGSEKVSTAFLMECSPYNKTTYGKKRINHVGLSPKHSLSIVTEVGATATDVKDFVALVTAAVEKIFSITIETEVDMIFDT